MTAKRKEVHEIETLYSLIYDVELPKNVPGLKGRIDLDALVAEMIAVEAKGDYY